jgi:phosphoglycerate dehydrogenase-like enzyme
MFMAEGRNLHMMKAIFIGDMPNTRIDKVYPPDLRERIAAMTRLHPEVVGRHNFRAVEIAPVLKEADIAFSTWGMTCFSEEEIAECMPYMKALLYGAGSVQAFARPFLNRGILVSSAWVANGVPVSQFALAQILLANKGYWQGMTLAKQGNPMAGAFSDGFPGNFRVRVGLIGIGAIGTMVAELLQPFHFEVLAFDPFLSDEKAARLHLHKADLDEIFSSCQTISNHLANVPATVGILNRRHFRMMLPNATFLNTGRGAQVVEADLADALREAPARTAVLDVTDPEPMRPDNPLIGLPNVFLTPHIAGSTGREVVRMGEWMLEELERLIHGKPLLYGVTLQMLETMA